MSIRLICALLVSAAVTSPVLAQPNDPVSATVQITDLNLATPKDRARLNTRVRSAAHIMCRSGLGGTAAQAIEAKCVQTALASARPQVDLAIATASAAVQIAAVSLSHGG
jgi:UrcA family protein